MQGLQVSTDRRLEPTAIFEQNAGPDFYCGHTLTSYHYITEDFMIRDAWKGFLAL